MSSPLLSVRGVTAYYGHVKALKGVDIDVNDGEIVALIGANGAGKSTLMMTVCGNPRARDGQIVFAGRDITRLPTHEIARLKLAQAPEGRRIFPRMTVLENLQMGALVAGPAEFDRDLERVVALFPRLRQRLHQRGGTLSGGEQQMLAIARALMSRPRLLLLDEPSLGLAPLIVKQIFNVIADLNKKLEAKGVLPVAYWDNGAHVYTANKPLIRPEDFRGMKMRIQGSKVLDAVARELGAIPQIIAFGELYQTLQTGVADGEDNVPSNIWTQKFYEVQKYLTVSYHGRLTYALVTNKKFWDGLPADVKEPLRRAVKETTDYFNETAAKDNDEALEKIKATGKLQFHYLTDEEKKAWVAKLMPVHKEMWGRFGKDFIEKIYKASGFVAPQS